MINVTSGEFFGPFDLLLDLIEKSKVDIYEISISDITTEYIASINNMKIDAQEITDFILIASKLLYIKTKSLIKDTIEIEAEQEELTKEDLIKRLIEYKKIKTLIKLLKNNGINGYHKYSKYQEDLSLYKKDNYDDLIYDPLALKNVLSILINKNSDKEEFNVGKILNREEYSLEKYLVQIKLDIFKNNILNITHMLKKVTKKSEAIIIFLSVLELSKLGDLNIIQDKKKQ